MKRKEIHFEVAGRSRGTFEDSPNPYREGSASIGGIVAGMVERVSDEPTKLNRSKNRLIVNGVKMGTDELDALLGRNILT